MKGRSILDGQFRDLGLADRRHAKLADGLAEALRQEAVDDFLANVGREATLDDRLGYFAGTEAGNLGMSLVIARDPAERFGYVFSRNVQDQLAGTVGIQDR